MAFTNRNNAPFGIGLQKGDVENFSGVHKFGYNSAVGTAYETIWDGGGTYAYPSTPGVATVTSDDSNDNTGTVLVQGLDNNYDLAEETITIGGSAGTQTFSRVFRVIMKTAATGNTNAGTITVTVDSTAVAKISEGIGQTLMCVYTIPRNYCGYIIQLDVGSSKDLENEIRLITKEIDNGNIWATKTFVTTRGGFIEKNYVVPLKLPEKTDIEIVAKSSATSEVSAGFELVLQKIGGSD